MIKDFNEVNAVSGFWKKNYITFFNQKNYGFLFYQPLAVLFHRLIIASMFLLSEK